MRFVNFVILVNKSTWRSSLVAACDVWSFTPFAICWIVMSIYWLDVAVMGAVQNGE